MVVGQQFKNMKNNIVKVSNWISGDECIPANKTWFNKYNPHTGEIQCAFADSNSDDINLAIESAAIGFKTNFICSYIGIGRR